MSQSLQTISEIKDSAKGKLNGKYGIAVRATLVFMMMSYVIAGIASQINDIIRLIFTNGKNLQAGALIFMLIITNVILAIGTVLAGCFSSGIALFYLKIGSNMMPRVGDLFWGFRDNFKRSFTVALLIEGVGALVSIPGYVIYDMVTTRMELNALLEAFAFIAGGYIVNVIIGVCFGMVWFVIADFPELTAGAAIKKAWELINGNKAKYFGMNLSFIPLILLCVLTFGIGFLWVYPYMYETEAQFYLELTKAREEV